MESNCRYCSKERAPPALDFGSQAKLPGRIVSLLEPGMAPVSKQHVRLDWRQSCPAHGRIELLSAWGARPGVVSRGARQRSPRQEARRGTRPLPFARPAPSELTPRRGGRDGRGRSSDGAGRRIGLRKLPALGVGSVPSLSASAWRAKVARLRASTASVAGDGV